LGQQSLGKVEAFLKLCQLSLGVVQCCGVLLQLVTEPGKFGWRGSPPAYCSGDCPRNQHDRTGGDRESEQEDGFPHIRATSKVGNVSIDSPDEAAQALHFSSKGLRVSQRP
jgi:hypothetical protein